MVSMGLLMLTLTGIVASAPAAPSPAAPPASLAPVKAATSLDPFVDFLAFLARHSADLGRWREGLRSSPYGRLRWVDVEAAASRMTRRRDETGLIVLVAASVERQISGRPAGEARAMVYSDAKHALATLFAGKGAATVAVLVPEKLKGVDYPPPGRAPPVAYALGYVDGRLGRERSLEMPAEDRPAYLGGRRAAVR
jgi:hypothetical protein